jgi:hypothetical protein
MSGEEAVPFQSPPSLEREFTLPNSGKVKGMAIARGITLIVGGGFHGAPLPSAPNVPLVRRGSVLTTRHDQRHDTGKSTLLEALQVGVYNKIPGDGREFVVCDPDAVTVRGVSCVSRWVCVCVCVFSIDPVRVDQGGGRAEHREREHFAVHR